LAQHFLQTYAARLKLPAAKIAPDAEEALVAYDWPGNIRELENAIHYALIISKDGVVQADDLRVTHRPVRMHSHRLASAVTPEGEKSNGNSEKTHASTSPTIFPVQVDGVSSSFPSSVSSVPVDNPQTLLEERLQELLGSWIESADPQLFERFESALIKTAFVFCRGNQVQTAKVLGISRNVLRTQLKRYSLLEFRSRSTKSSVDEEGTRAQVGLST
jgi:sigma-54-specific transcriptional regulator